MSKSKYGVFIGRFSVPTPHQGHRHALGMAASQCEHLIVLIGSANAAPSIKNPWSVDHRISAMRSFLHSIGVKFTILPVNDYAYIDSQWIADVRSSVEYVAGPNVIPTLFGHTKDGNNYLQWFPDWGFKEIPSEIKIDATSIREQMFESNSNMIPENIRADWEYFKKEKLIFENYPFPETLNFNCSDVILECLGNIVLIKRKSAPGRDLWALPGGFKNRNETFLNCAIRELFEETGVKVPEKVIRGSIVKTELFDNPSRNMGIPRNSLVVHVKIEPNNDGSLPKLRPADDASDANWFPLHDVINNMLLFDDHLGIISKVTGVISTPAHLKYSV